MKGRRWSFEGWSSSRECVGCFGLAPTGRTGRATFLFEPRAVVHPHTHIVLRRGSASGLLEQLHVSRSEGSH